MAEPVLQVEVQLGHLCNNRCVFCVSGQLSEQKRAPQLPAEPIRRQIADARRSGAAKITFLGGEPTMQASFFGMLQFAVDQEFQEVVIFTNGTMTPRESFRQRVLKVLDGLGADARKRVIWRFSLQGGTREAHDATTLNDGAWDRIIASMDQLKTIDARLTGNMCVVESNWRSLPDLADVAAKYGFENLHLDMIRPRDSGDRTDEHLRAIMARYTDMAPALAELLHRCDRTLGPDFDLNFGNVPYCTAPDVTHRIHHDGQFTVTVAADGEGGTQLGFDKYEDKRSDKHKPLGCASCVFDGACSGVFDKYREFYGDAEFVPVTPDDLWQRDVAGHHFLLLAKPAVEALARSGLWRVARTDDHAQEMEVVLPVDPDDAQGPGWRLALRRPLRRGARRGWWTLAGDRLEIALLGPQPNHPDAIRVLRDALVMVAGALGAELPSMDDAALARAWSLENARLEAQRQRDMRTWRHLATLADRLRSEPLAGLRPGAVRRKTEDLAVELDFAGPDGQLTLTIAAADAADERFVPRFSHRADTMAASAVSAFSLALGRKLRGGAPVRAAV